MKEQKEGRKIETKIKEKLYGEDDERKKIKVR